MTTKDKDMSEQELFESAMIRAFGKRINLDRHIEPVDDYTTADMYKSENVEWASLGWKLARAPLLARIAELEAKLAEETKRLDYVLDNKAFAPLRKTDAGGIAWQLMARDEDGNYITLSGETKLFTTKRAAIDDAMRGNE